MARRQANAPESTVSSYARLRPVLPPPADVPLQIWAGRHGLHLRFYVTPFHGLLHALHIPLPFPGLVGLLKRAQQ